MRKRGGIRKNNRGDSLILVIGCIALLSVLGIVILAKSVDNQTMKVTERNAQNSFFEADSTSAELAAVLEAVALEAVEDAFSDMLVEYSTSASEAARNQRYKEYFEARLTQRLSNVSGNQLWTLLDDALPDEELTNVTVDYDGIELVAGGTGETDTIKIKNVQMTYSASGSETKVTTDINIKTQIPDVIGGFRPTVQCTFSDFALVSDGAIAMNSAAGANVIGNLYTGGDLTVSGAGYDLNITDTSKVLVKGDMLIDGGASVTIDSGSVPGTDEPSVWANGIYVQGGGTQYSSLSTTGMSAYVADDLTVEGTKADVSMTGADAEYVGYSGGAGVSGLTAYQQSSAITVNAVQELNLDLGALKQVVLNGVSYIHEDSWDERDGEGNITAVAGIMQGESVAYKDMQAMYLVPNEYMAAGHNPAMNSEPDTATIDSDYNLGGGVIIDWDEYLVAGEPYLVRKLLLDEGATKATYLYLNFKDEAAAAKYINLYLSSPKGDAIKNSAKNLNSGTIKLPTATYAKGNVLTYDGTTKTATIRPSVSSAGLPILASASMIAKYNYNSLFTSLQRNVGGALTPGYQMVAGGIATVGAQQNLGLVKEVTVPDPVATATEYTFYYYDGDLEVNGGDDYSSLNGILLVNGSVKVDSGAAHMKGVILATGSVEIAQGVTLEANPTAVETLLTDSEVASYFSGTGIGGAGHQYLSSEAVDITFENWKRN